jgi:hypothetical protein
MDFAFISNLLNMNFTEISLHFHLSCHCVIFDVTKGSYFLVIF